MDISLLHASPFYEIAALLALAAGIGLAGQLLRQPVVVSFIVVGIVVGPSVLDIVQSREKIDLMAELGIAVLLFLVGLKLDLKLIRTLGWVSLATGLGQVLFTSVFGFLIALALGLAPVPAVYVAVALTFSSTIIIVKLLTDKREADSLHGRIAIGFLIVQDVVVVLAMLVLSSVGIGTGGDEGGTLLQVGNLVLKGALLVGGIVLFSAWLARPLMQRVARSTELMIIFSVAWAVLLAAIAHFLGFSKELGGLAAGIALASTPFREAIVARLAPLRDFLLLFFFIALGAELNLGLLGDQVAPALVFSVFVLIGNPLIVMVIMGIMGFRKRTGFLAGLTVAQISEFSLIFIAMGVTLGHVTGEALGLVTLVGLITIALSVYMITYSHTLYRWLEPVLGVFERRHPYREEELESRHQAADMYDVVLFGIGRYGKAIAEFLKQENLKVLAVDFNPDEIRHWRERGMDAVYGDAGDQELIGSLPWGRVRLVLSALPQQAPGLTHEDPRLALIDELKRQRFEGRIVVSTHATGEIEALRRRGADIVLCPFVDAAESAVIKVREALQGKP